MKKALITGGTKGIGRAIAQKFLEEGYEVIINYCHDEEAAIAAQNELNSLDYCPVLMRADVSDEKQVKDMFAEIYRIFGGIDVLVNNAGISKVNVIQDTTLADWEEVVGVNLRGVFLCCREAARSMVSRGRGGLSAAQPLYGARWARAARWPTRPQREGSLPSPRRSPRNLPPRTSPSTACRREL